MSGEETHPEWEDRGGIERRLLRQARSMNSPLYSGLLERCAEDTVAGGPCWPVLRGHGKDPPDSALGLRLMAALHRLVLDGRAPELTPYYPSVGGRTDVGAAWPVISGILEQRADTIRDLVTRPLQTNEVGRSQGLLCGFLQVAARTDLPLRLLEVGAGAGLNLRWDHYHYEARGRRRGDSDSPVRLCSFDDVPDAFDLPVVIDSRRGCDQAPVDPTTDEGKLTLMSCVWADHVHRVRQLRLALGVAQQVPVTIDRDAAGSWLSEQLARPAAGVATVVFHSIVMQYLAESERRSFEHSIAGAGAAASEQAPLAWLRLEPAGAECAVTLTVWPAGEEAVVARCGYHGEGVRPSHAPLGRPRPRSPA